MADDTTPEQPAAPKKRAPRKPATPKAAQTPDATTAAPETPTAAVPAPVEPTPVPAAGDPLAAPPAAPAAPRKRPIWPFVLGGAILVFILVIVGIVLAVLAVTGAFSGGPNKTVLEYDRAFKETDCPLFLSTLSDGYVEAAFGGELDCTAWADNAKNYTVDGEYVFTVKVTGTTVDGDEAQVTTHETDVSSGEPVEYDVRYYLVEEDGSWVIDNIADETE